MNIWIFEKYALFFVFCMYTTHSLLLLLILTAGSRKIQKRSKFLNLSMMKYLDSTYYSIIIWIYTYTKMITWEFKWCSLRTIINLEMKQIWSFLCVHMFIFILYTVSCKLWFMIMIDMHWCRIMSESKRQYQ